MKRESGAKVHRANIQAAKVSASTISFTRSILVVDW